VLGGIGRVVGDGLGADVVDRLVEGRADRRWRWSPAARAGAAVAAHERHGVGLVDLQVRSRGALTLPLLQRAICGIWSPTGTVSRAAVGDSFLKRNWKVRSSFASPLLSMWISYSAFGPS
jgi:hypothetical protein